jgi:hypothetical protein
VTALAKGVNGVGPSMIPTFAPDARLNSVDCRRIDQSHTECMVQASDPEPVAVVINVRSEGIARSRVGGSALAIALRHTR